MVSGMNLNLAPQSTAYGWLMLAGVVITITFWTRLAKSDDRLMLIYLAALVSAFVGAKIVYLGAEGWLHWHDDNRWIQFATGKSVLGALLGGYAGVEIAKRVLRYRQTTGDWFALVAPVGIMLGRVGCVMHGCCLGNACEPSWYTMNDAAGVARWPAAAVELIFNVLALGIILLLRRNRVLPGQHFHLYLMAYGLFRFAHEFMRATPRILGPLSGYQIAALAVALLGLVGFIVRRRANTAPARRAEGH